MSQNNTVTANVIVSNEEQWVWYAIMSVIDWVDKVLVYDTGSTDKTVAIIKSIKSKKISFSQKGRVDASGLTRLRQQQLDQSQTDWIMILDGDEIWPVNAIKEAVALVGKSDSLKTYGIVMPAWNLIGDLYHFHPESTDYHWPYAPVSLSGWMNLRFINRKIPGLNIKKDYPLEAYCDQSQTPIQNYGTKKLLFGQNRYFHMTYLPRSSSDRKNPGLKRGPKKIPEIGRKLPAHITLPEVFNLARPEIVPHWNITQPYQDKIKALMLTPFKRLKRKIVPI